MGTTHIVICGIFNSGDGEDKNQRHNGGEPGQGRDLWDQLGRGKRRHASEAPPVPSPPLDLSPAGLYLALGVAKGLPRVTYLQNKKEQEVGIGNFLELLKEVDRQEGENIVLGGLDAVTLWQWERRQ